MPKLLPLRTVTAAVGALNRPPPKAAPPSPPLPPLGVPPSPPNAALPVTAVPSRTSVAPSALKMPPPDAVPPGPPLSPGIPAVPTIDPAVTPALRRVSLPELKMSPPWLPRTAEGVGEPVPPVIVSDEIVTVAVGDVTWNTRLEVAPLEPLIDKAPVPVIVISTPIASSPCDSVMTAPAAGSKVIVLAGSALACVTA